jgi:hypothetical protein
VIPLLRNDLIEYLTPQRDRLRAKYSLHDLRTIGFIHVRRGDYLTAPTGFSRLDYDTYYRRALANAPPCSRWLVLSDDPLWCKDREEFSSFEVIDEPEELAGLALMSLCHGAAIIANSTYSWWGAMLGPEATHAPVFYPLKWLNNARPTIFRDTWIGID